MTLCSLQLWAWQEFPRQPCNPCQHKLWAVDRQTLSYSAWEKALSQHTYDLAHLKLYLANLQPSMVWRCPLHFPAPRLGQPTL